MKKLFKYKLIYLRMKYKELRGKNVNYFIVFSQIFNKFLFFKIKTCIFISNFLLDYSKNTISFFYVFFLLYLEFHFANFKISISYFLNFEFYVIFHIKRSKKNNDK